MAKMQTINPSTAISSPRLHNKGKMPNNFRIVNQLSRQKSSKLKA
jgi:hypothetical protein